MRPLKIRQTIADALRADAPYLRPLRRVLVRSEQDRAQLLLRLISGCLADEPRGILDIGAGTCLLAEQIQRQVGCDVTAVDINDFSLSDRIRPVLYDGRHLPFPDRAFGLAMLLFVLHHLPRDHAVGLLEEAHRVADRLLIMEDIYETTLQKYYTFLFDRVSNFEFIGRHPHANRTDREWQAIFDSLGLRLLRRESVGYYGIRFGIYHLAGR